jgi:hypothetical protein
MSWVARNARSLTTGNILLTKAPKATNTDETAIINSPIFLIKSFILSILSIVDFPGNQACNIIAITNIIVVILHGKSSVLCHEFVAVERGTEKSLANGHTLRKAFSVFTDH